MLVASWMKCHIVMKFRSQLFIPLERWNPVPRDLCRSIPRSRDRRANALLRGTWRLPCCSWRCTMSGGTHSAVPFALKIVRILRMSNWAQTISQIQLSFGHTKYARVVCTILTPVFTHQRYARRFRRVRKNPGSRAGCPPLAIPSCRRRQSWHFSEP